MLRTFTMLLAVLMATSGCADTNATRGAPKVPVVRYAYPIEREVTDYEYFTGRTAAVDHVQVKARVTGYLEKINFKAGSNVKEGDTLFIIDPRPYQATYDRALGQIAIAESKLKLASVELARGLSIAKTPGAISQADLDKYAADKSSAEATLQAAKADAESANLNLKFTDVKSPINGVVGNNLITIGNLVTQDNTLLTTVVSMDPMYAYFDVDERTMLRVQKLIREGKIKSVKEGAETPVQFGLANEGNEFPNEGKLDFVNNQIDASTGTLQVRGVIPNPQSKSSKSRLLTPGLFLRVRLPIGEPHKSLLVPQAAIGTDQGKKFLYVVNEKNVVEYRPIDPGPLEADMLQVVHPLKIVRSAEGVRLTKPGEEGVESLAVTDKVIVSGLQRVRSGMTVDPKPAADQRK
ncbi:MAG: efflux RND transporter periplasmic adaptor subunit [Planctomycetota bacterium]